LFPPDASPRVRQPVRFPPPPDGPAFFLVVALEPLAAASETLAEKALNPNAAAEVIRLDPTWTVEKYLSDAGGMPESAATLFIDAAEKSGVLTCVSADKLPSIPNLIRIKACDEERTRQVAGWSRTVGSRQQPRSCYLLPRAEMGCAELSPKVVGFLRLDSLSGQGVLP
jgi:hypothetical protein